ncbi:MAG: DNA helicase PcrA [Eubacteriales bacterium]|nr:DNA helicase PcrA [Eubacteriales bacterium]
MLILNLLENLNPMQKEAVQHVEGPLLILAGAGSGKTRVIIHRIAYLIYEKKVSPYNILAITFTNKAASEMKLRLANLIGTDGEKVWTSTFHSMCVRILRREIQHLDYSPDFVIYDTQDQLSVIKTILKERNLEEKKYPPRLIIDRISNYKNQLIGATQSSKYALNYFDEVITEIYKDYQKKLFNFNGLDFDDLIMLMVRLFREHPEVLDKYQERFKYILVDEYQDTNMAQYELVKLLASKYKNLCVVGDDDQSIYQWRGADIKNILEFEADYTNTKIIKLEQNYRSTKTIIDAANSVVSKNSLRKDKTLTTDKENGEKIYYYPAYDEVEEASFIANKIEILKDAENKNYKDFAILCRVTSQFRAIEEGLIRKGLPYKIFGGVKFYERKEIKDILAYLRLVVNQGDEISLKRVINSPKRGIGEGSWEKLAAYAQEKGITIYETMEFTDEAEISKRTSESIKNFKKMMDHFKEENKNNNVTDITNLILMETGYIEELKNEKTIEAETRLENLQEFLSVTTEYDQTSVDGNLSQFLSETALVSDTDTYQEDDDAVVMMTIHSSKGLEFPVVFITGLEENIFPHSRSLNSGDDTEVEEERRLCYVAITRAEDQLFITRAWRRKMFGRDSYNQQSRFIGEIPKKFIHNDESKEKQVNMNQDTIPKIAPIGKDSDFLAIGDQIEHKKWGVGCIVAIHGDGEDAEISIAFPNLGIKKLIGKYAPIVKIK